MLSHHMYSFILSLKDFWFVSIVLVVQTMLLHIFLYIVIFFRVYTQVGVELVFYSLYIFTFTKNVKLFSKVVVPI